MTLIEQLQAISNAFRAARGLSEGRVSTLVFGDGMKLHKISSGGDLTTSRFEAAMIWFSDNWPEKAKWPACVPRPHSCSTVIAAQGTAAAGSASAAVPVTSTESSRRWPNCSVVEEDENAAV